jgi:hypothetical protein
MRQMGIDSFFSSTQKKRKRNKDAEAHPPDYRQNISQVNEAVSDVFAGIECVVRCSRSESMSSLFEKHGGVVHSDPSPTTTHLLIDRFDAEIERMLLDFSLAIVSPSWITDSVRLGELQDEGRFLPDKNECEVFGWQSVELGQPNLDSYVFLVLACAYLIYFFARCDADGSNPPHATEILSKDHTEKFGAVPSLKSSTGFGTGQGELDPINSSSLFCNRCRRPMQERKSLGRKFSRQCPFVTRLKSYKYVSSFARCV